MSVKKEFEKIALANSYRCDWCGRPAVTRNYRTLNVDTVYEQTGLYFECTDCCGRATDDVVGRYTILCTCPEDDKNYCKVFVVETEWLLSYWSEETDGEFPIEDFYEFINNEYTWDWSWFVYESAKREKEIVTEYEQR